MGLLTTVTSIILSLSLVSPSFLKATAFTYSLKSPFIIEFGKKPISEEEYTTAGFANAPIVTPEAAGRCVILASP
ncbi:MAG: hypothetical protein NZ901_06175 [Geminocystis sp.]|nr:hypothetical protein [Geminocystis sp.]MCS7147765.1 hypothetical protein [Geminocystis sp.]MDW8116661.1 hypothetical protein [Geminocystis sp.]MDW8463933.1 hypothetical protein [Geminocystis sp.]